MLTEREIANKVPQDFMDLVDVVTSVCLLGVQCVAYFERGEYSCTLQMREDRVFQWNFNYEGEDILKALFELDLHRGFEDGHITNEERYTGDCYSAMGLDCLRYFLKAMYDGLLIDDDNPVTIQDWRGETIAIEVGEHA